METKDIKIGDIVEWTVKGSKYRARVTSRNLYDIQRKFNTAPKWAEFTWRIVNR